MKTSALLLASLFCAVGINTVAAKAPKAIPQNSSRKLMNAYTGKMFKDVGDLSKTKPRVKLATINLKALGKDWTPRYQSSKDGKTLIIRYQPKNDKRLELGSATVFLTDTPFKGKLKDAPSVLDEGVAIEFEVQCWRPQKWKTYTIPALKSKVRGFMDVQSGGADNEMVSTEPFSFTDKSGKKYWCIVSIEAGYHKTKGMSLAKALKVLKVD